MRARGAMLLIVDDPRGLQHEQAELFELDDRVGDRSLHELVLAEGLALRPPRHRALEHHVDGALTLADGPHRMMDASAAEARLRDLEAFADRKSTRLNSSH